MTKGHYFLAAASLALVGCSTSGGAETQSASRKAPTSAANSSSSATAKAAFNKDPYPSTYKAYAGQPTAVRGATIFDGEGGRIDNGTILLLNGKVEAVGG